MSKNKLYYKINGVGLNLSKIILKQLKKKRHTKILVIAAYKKEKGYMELLKVAESLKNDKKKIVCFGSGDYKKFRSIRAKKKLTNIYFNKFDQNLNKKIKNFDLLLHLSQREGLPVSVMQSLSRGLPVICHNIRGNIDLIKDGYNGFFVKTYKDVALIIHYLNLDNMYFNQIRSNAVNSINKSFSEKEIYLKVFDIIKKFYKAKNSQ